MEDDASAGITTWSDPSNATSDNGSYATTFISGMAGANSHYLKATNFGFSIPASATINGITVEWDRKQSDTDIMVDDAIRIVIGGTIKTTDKSSVSYWPTTEAYASYGGAADLWSETPTASDINASNFGAALAVKLGVNGNSTASVDHARITVY